MENVSWLGKVSIQEVLGRAKEDGTELRSAKETRLEIRRISE